MKKTGFILVLLFAIACSNDVVKNNENTATTNTDSLFNNYKEAFVEELWKLYPGWAANEGYDKYDTVLTVLSDEFRKQELAFTATHIDFLKSYSIEKLSPLNKIDYYLMENALRSIQWYINEYREYEWNPSYYNVAGGFALIMNDRNTTLEEKLRKVSLKTHSVPAYYNNAKENIKNPTIEHTDLAIQRTKGVLNYFEKTLIDSLSKAKMGTHESHLIEAKINESVAAIKNYLIWLEQELKPNLSMESARSFRIGKELYEKKFAYDIQSDYTAEQIYTKALQRKNELHKEMYKISTQLWNKYMGKKPVPVDSLLTIRVMIDYLSAKHVHRDSFIAAIEKQISELVEFVNEKGLLYLDPSKPLVVRKTPEYMAGVAGASISSPGPYDKEANTYYNVTPLTEYSDKEAESYLREYNHYVLQILNIHEAIPGHYVQLIYSNQSPSIIKSILGNGAMIEGWAVYTERMMLEEGYGNNEPEMWLMYYKWHLRVVCNTILDYSVHVLGMTREEALELLMKEAFQEETEAKGKWKRVTLSQVQLCSYFTGFTEIYALREELKQKQGDKFSLKEFHEEFLSYGSAPVKYIRHLMLEK